MSAGKIMQQDIPSKIYLEPVNRFVADFIGSCNLLECSVIKIENGISSLSVDHLGTVEVCSSPSHRVGARGTLALRPEHVQIDGLDLDSDRSNSFVGKVGAVLYKGDVSVISVQVSEHINLNVLVANAGFASDEFVVDQKVRLSWTANLSSFISN